MPSGTDCIKIFSPTKTSHSSKGSLTCSFGCAARRSTKTEDGIGSVMLIVSFCACFCVALCFDGRGGGGGGGGESRAEAIAGPLPLVFVGVGVEIDVCCFGLRPCVLFGRPLPARSLSKHLHTYSIPARRDTLTVSIRSMSSCSDVCEYG